MEYLKRELKSQEKDFKVEVTSNSMKDELLKKVWEKVRGPTLFLLQNIRCTRNSMMRTSPTIFYIFYVFKFFMFENM